MSTKNYTYGNNNWKDLLTNYNGKTITYDAIGNPLSDGTWSYTWQEGRKLATMSKGSTTWTYTYDTNGMRTRRTTGTSTYNYTYHGSQLTHMTYGSIGLHFYYDASGKPLSVIYNGNTYYYVLNLQGDVVAILDSTGAQVVGYRYDAWGRLLATTGSLSSTLGVYNPLRYRGYVYDRETGLYYVSSRYYNPEIGRFINADSLASTGQGILGCNMFAYCGNNPVSRGDSNGYAWETVFDVISLGSSALEVIANPTNAWAWAGLAGDIIDVAIPFVGGVGEGIDALRVATKATEGADNALDAMKVVKKGGSKADFYITPAGDAIPAKMTQFKNNLSKMNNVNGKYLGETINGPVRVRIEGPHPLDKNFNGDWNSDHFINHIHIEHRKNGNVGPWGKGFNNKTTIPLDWINGGY